ncbi:MAG TPA: HAMP domain-containing sensor histidine kinase [Dehalococcoidia bacterium]|nr:HAMP domain-containing sensor histidine kinase [Dehalococcoidia bacterium]
MSIRLRLTLLYTAVLAVTLLVLGGVLYFWTARSLRSEIDRSLQARSGRLAYVPSAGPRAADGALLLRMPPLPPSNCGAGTPATGSDASRAARQALSFLDDRLGDPTILTQINDSQGNILYCSANLNGEKLPPPKPSSRRFTTLTVKGVDLRVFVQPLNVASRPAAGDAAPSATTSYVIQFARPLTDVEKTLGHMRFILLLGSIAALALAAGAGYLLARGALRPIDRLTMEAQRVGRKQDFKRRVAYRGPDDEVGRLASTFNTMLDGLDAAHEQQRRALDAQRRFVADASHELRTPLTTIRGNVELLSLDAPAASPDQQEALADIASETERMSRLVASLLALARADSGLHIQKRPVEVQPVLEEVLQKATWLNGHVQLDLAGSVAAKVAGDRDHLLQLFFILVDNALKYTPAGGLVTIAPSFEHGTLRVAVSDTGVGIAEADQRRIFDRFYRADPSRHGEGTGLGLAIAAWIVHELDGTIGVESRPGAGSTFTVTLPAQPSPPATAAAAQPELVAGAD